MDRRIAWTIVVVTVVAGWQTGLAGGSDNATELEALARRAVAGESGTVAADIAQLRQAGRAGLDALFTVHAAAIQRALRPELEAALSGATASDPSAWGRIRHALDEVGGQRDCYASHLYWYTDLQLAQAVARQEGKPILSLRLLGKLTDEFSCANSRFFRSTLYANQAVSQVLRERFVLHWQTVRPVPIVTIDFGDGRTLRRTVTGNSVHYVLDSNGRPVDALPGLYGPQAFLRGLEPAERMMREIATTDNAATFARRLTDYHRAQLDDLERAWQADLRQLGMSQAAQPPAGQFRQVAAKAAPPRADEAGQRAQPKRAVERPIVAAALNLPAEPLSTTPDDKVWARIAALHAADAALDAGTRNLIARQQPTAAAAAPRAITKAVVEDPLVRLLGNLRQAVALDTVRNEYLLHRQIHSWFIARQIGDLASLNERVYAELFLTPSSDPWLGLTPADTYTGLDSDGVQNCSRDE